MPDGTDADPWLALDKLYHVLFCFFLASLSRYPFLRHHSIWVGSILSLTAGAAKEAADHLGFFRSAGASAKDSAADFFGVLIAAFMLSMRKRQPKSESGPTETRRVLQV